METNLKDDIKTLWEDLKIDIPKFLFLFATRWYGLATIVLLLLLIAVIGGWYFSSWIYGT